MNGDGTGKYALVRLRDARDNPVAQAHLQALDAAGVIDWGRVGQEDEFFVMKLRDVHAQDGLVGYAGSALRQDAEYAEDVLEMAARAGRASPFCKNPD